MAIELDVIQGSAGEIDQDSVENRIARLELRLHDGLARIGEAMATGQDVERWERYWVDLLRQYESLHDELGAAA